MPELISKVQYKNCEDGEYFDEKPRNLEETLALIQSYPWAREQYAHLDLTGPSVTIENKKGEFFRLGIYYGGKYTLHYLDTKHNYYTQKNITMDTATNAVTNFFSNALSLRDFEKHSFAFIRKYFKTKSFEYKFTFWGAFVFTFGWFLLFAIFAVATVWIFFQKHADEGAFALPGVVAFVFGSISLYTVDKLFRVRDQYLRISRGNDVFAFGDNSGDIKEYNKTDIARLVIYDNYTGRKHNRTTTSLEIYEVDFCDGSFIRFSNVLISGSDLDAKFSNKWKFEQERIGMNGFDLLREL